MVVQDKLTPRDFGLMYRLSSNSEKNITSAPIIDIIALLNAISNNSPSNSSATYFVSFNGIAKKFKIGRQRFKLSDFGLED